MRWGEKKKKSLCKVWQVRFNKWTTMLTQHVHKLHHKPRTPLVGSFIVQLEARSDLTFHSQATVTFTWQLGPGSAEWLLEMEMECRSGRECGWARPVCPPHLAADVLLISSDRSSSFLPALCDLYTCVWKACLAVSSAASLTFKTQMELNFLLKSIEFSICVCVLVHEVIIS